MRAPTGPGVPGEADDLYAADPVGFVAARDALAKSLRASGDREGAAAVKALRRPTVGAWYANVAARAGLVSLREWLRLGERLREAQASGDFTAVREAGAERARLESRVLRDLAAHLASTGVTATAAGLEEVRATLRAALADEAAADAVRAGRLSRPLEYAGFGEVDMSAALAAMARAREEAAGASGGVAEPGDDDRAGAPGDAEADERDRREREREAERARLERDLVATRSKLADAEAAARAAEARVDQARRALAAAERAGATASSNAALLAERVADLEAQLAD